jgi:hypothetical protein
MSNNICQTPATYRNYILKNDRTQVAAPSTEGEMSKKSPLQLKPVLLY